VDISALYSLYLAHPSVQTDTRKLQPGDLFFALKGPSFNGNAFADAALSAGAAAVIIDEAEYRKDERYVLVDDVLPALQELARHHRRQFDIPFLAITGSNGKTTTKELLTAVLREKFVTYATSGNLNNHIGVPLTLLQIKNDAQIAVIEMGANHRGEIASYCKIAEPTHGLINNVGKAHIEGFGGEEGVRLGKGELYDYLRETGGTIYRNADLSYLEKMAEGIEKQITYGAAAADYQGDAGMDGLFVNVQLEKPVRGEFRTHLVGAYNFPNVMAAIAVGMDREVPVGSIRAALDKYQPDNSRSQWIKRGTNEIILDAYNANPSSMRAAIENFAMSNLANKRLWLGAMKEMGSASESEHAALVALADQYPWNEVILVGQEFAAVKGAHIWFPDAASAADLITSSPPEHASILIKGSRGSRMELLLDALQ
jgi:UDP-N-acetylmuramoyl-tripeptide--D-alanyl-D-alanine ligase